MAEKPHDERMKDEGGKDEGGPPHHLITSSPHHKELPDYSVYLTPQRLQHEESEWAKVRTFERYAQALIQMKARSILEIGCGTGWIPWELKRLKYPANYSGIDANLYCLQIAHDKNPGIPFVYDDIRSLPINHVDTICAFALLKHFGLHEWHQVFGKFILSAPRSVFTMNVADRTFDSGEEWHHTWLSDKDLKTAIESRNHRIVNREVFSIGEHGNEELIWTTRNTKLIYAPGGPQVN